MVVYRASGLAMSVAFLRGRRAEGPLGVLRRTYIREFWHPWGLLERLDIVIAVILWPVAIPLTALWMVARNGGIVARRYGKGRLRQLAEQLILAGRYGILPLWYYMFELFRPEAKACAGDYVLRAEAKDGFYRAIFYLEEAQSPLNDKQAFAQHCRRHGVPVVETLAVAQGGALIGGSRDSVRLPPVDLFEKPVRASSGRGARRWDHLGEDRYRGETGAILGAREIIDRLCEASRSRPMMLQPRLVNHPALRPLANEALSTVRVITCLSEEGEPEPVKAALRMSVGANRTIDNFHAGGIGAIVDLASGRLAEATDMGTDARRGWLRDHPTTGAPIAGFVLPLWAEVCALSCAAHRAFADHIFIGWDIAILADRPVLIEGNSGPDLDGVQRLAREPMGKSRFIELAAFHLERMRAIRWPPPGEDQDHDAPIDTPFSKAPSP